MAANRGHARISAPLPTTHSTSNILRDVALLAPGLGGVTSSRNIPKLKPINVPGSPVVNLRGAAAEAKNWTPTLGRLAPKTRDGSPLSTPRKEKGSIPRRMIVPVDVTPDAPAAQSPRVVIMPSPHRKPVTPRIGSSAGMVRPSPRHAAKGDVRLQIELSDAQLAAVAAAKTAPGTPRSTLHKVASFTPAAFVVPAPDLDLDAAPAPNQQTPGTCDTTATSASVAAKSTLQQLVFYSQREYQKTMREDEREKAIAAAVKEKARKRKFVFDDGYGTVDPYKPDSGMEDSSSVDASQGGDAGGKFTGSKSKSFEECVHGINTYKMTLADLQAMENDDIRRLGLGVKHGVSQVSTANDCLDTGRLLCVMRYLDFQ